MGKWKNIILGEKMPNKDDPKYREKYEKDVEAGRRFARVTRIDRLAGHVQRFAEKHRGVFLGIVMAIVLGCLAVNIYHFTRAYRAHREQKVSSQEASRMLSAAKGSVSSNPAALPIPSRTVAQNL